ncbi:hypothetical protein BaRGS_00027143 [Batillaria attramentaria]|uniref:Uncharacterized protein n=1 Tax=Batillaria attramentaria TaxID=370345 RepID=A0ABD0K2K5_9CAEN
MSRTVKVTPQQCCIWWKSYRADDFDVDVFFTAGAGCVTDVLSDVCEDRRRDRPPKDIFRKLFTARILTLQMRRRAFWFPRRRDRLTDSSSGCYEVTGL